MLTAALLGLLQGVFEWLPVSSQGAVTLAGAYLLGREPDEALALALWLHLGTGLAAAVAFRADVAQLAAEALPGGPPRSQRLRFLVVATLVSAAVALPLLLALGDALPNAGGGAVVSLAIGALMMASGALQLRRPAGGIRMEGEAGLADAVLVGLAQGAAALPGLSRSGLTLAALLTRRMERQAALRLSFLMSIPASVGAALFAGLDSGLLMSGEGAVGAVVAAIVGFASIRALLALAGRVNFGWFVVLVGAGLAAGGAWQLLG
ncbi:MAG: UDP-diphosphatase [Dehalococcoidia bacterium]|nr:UDP-diphosphatase [Dehalococcoidia bacterium]